MAKLLVKEDVLEKVGFSKPQQANSYYPPNDSNYHIHLGVPTQVDGGVAPDGERFVTFVSIKNPTGQKLRQIHVGANAGKYDLDTSNVDWGKSKDDFKERLRKAGIGVDTK